MLGTQPFASATARMRPHSLPPSEMKSLYGTITSSAVISLSNAGPFTASPPVEWPDWRESTGHEIEHPCSELTSLVLAHAAQRQRTAESDKTRRPTPRRLPPHTEGGRHEQHAG